MEEKIKRGSYNINIRDIFQIFSESQKFNSREESDFLFLKQNFDRDQLAILIIILTNKINGEDNGR